MQRTLSIQPKLFFVQYSSSGYTLLTRLSKGGPTAHTLKINEFGQSFEEEVKTLIRLANELFMKI